MAKKSTRPLKTKPDAGGKLEFAGLRLFESASKLGELKKDQLPGRGIQFLNVTTMISEDLEMIHVNVRIKLDVSYDGDQTKEPAMSVLASFVATYSVVEPFIDKETVEKLVQQIALLNVWPYWREFVQTMTVRMGLPAFPVPLIYREKLIQEDCGDEDKS